MDEVTLGRPLGILAVEAIAHGRATPVLDDAAREKIAAGRAVVDRVVDRRIPAYGINTGVGSQKDFAIEPADIEAYNTRLIAAHATDATGPAASRPQVRAALAVQLNMFASGRPGVRPALVDALLARLLADDLPTARRGSSVGASDIVAMSQLSAPIVARHDGISGGHGPAPLEFLAAKEALALLNNNGFTVGSGALVVAEAARLLAAWDVVAALTLEGFRGNAGAWSAPVDAARGQPGQSRVGVRLRGALAGSALLGAGAARLLQDPLSIRCVPQIHGAADAALAFCWDAWERELNAVPDNPLTFWEEDRFISHGNMETSLLALSLDALRLGIAKVADAANERVHKVQWPGFSGLPPGLAHSSGVVGGVQFLNLGHIAAASAAAIHLHATPAVLAFRGQVCDGVEDVGGSAPLAVEQAERLLERAWVLMAVEAVCACYGILRRDVDPTTLGAGTGPLFSAVRPLLPIGREGDVVFRLAPVIEALKQ